MNDVIAHEEKNRRMVKSTIACFGAQVGFQGLSEQTQRPKVSNPSRR
jgi:hypothetical protein